MEQLQTTLVQGLLAQLGIVLVFAPLALAAFYALVWRKTSR